MKIFSLRYTLCLPSVRLLKEDAMLHAIFIIVTEVNPVRKSSTFQRGGSFTPLEKVSNRASGALNPVFAPLRDKSLTGFALKGIITSPRKRPEVLRGSSPLLAPLEIGY